VIHLGTTNPSKAKYRANALARGNCITCGTKPIADGYKSVCLDCLSISRLNYRRRADRLLAAGLCTACGKTEPAPTKRLCEWCAARRKANNQEQKLTKRCRTYGITPTDYQAMHKAQGGCCAICRRPGNGRWKELAIDHDHKTGAVRGLLCGSCNKAIGCLLDDPSVVRAAAAYLERSRPPVAATA
jgi:hypothetical protein